MTAGQVRTGRDECQRRPTEEAETGTEDGVYGRDSGAGRRRRVTAGEGGGLEVDVRVVGQAVDGGKKGSPTFFVPSSLPGPSRRRLDPT